MLPTVESAASVAVIGAGSWGTTVAAIMCEHTTTTLWGRNPELVDAIAQRHENPHYLAGVALPDALQATTHLDAACAGADVVVMAVPSHGYPRCSSWPPRTSPLASRWSAWPRASSAAPCCG